MKNMRTTEQVVLYQGIRDILLVAQTQVRQAVNTTMVLDYWKIGCLIVEREQDGRRHMIDLFPVQAESYVIV